MFCLTTKRVQSCRSGAKTIKKNTNSTQNKSQTHEVTSFLSTDCELSTETCSKNVYSLGPRGGNLKDAHLPKLYTLNGEVLCDSACVKYLGHFICSDLTDDTDIMRQRRCLSIQGNVLLRKFHMCSIGVRLALFMSFCSPMYTSQLWWNYKKCTMKRLLITYHNVLKMSISMSKYESTSLLCTVD